MSIEPSRYSKSQVRKAGETLRRLSRSGGFTLTGDQGVEWVWAMDVLDNFRAAHEYPLTKATMGLRSRVKTVLRETTGTDEGPLDISQRLKRHASILAKLRREPMMKLNTMQDIGGCRAVVAPSNRFGPSSGGGSAPRTGSCAPTTTSTRPSRAATAASMSWSPTTID